MADDFPDADVPCNGCFACCTKNAILLIDGEDDPAHYQTEQAGPGVMLAHKDNGDCVYLDRAKGCTIYDRRPLICRFFDCRKFYLKHSRHERRAAIATKDNVMMAGRARVHTLSAAVSRTTD